MAFDYAELNILSFLGVSLVGFSREFWELDREKLGKSVEF